MTSNLLVGLTFLNTRPHAQAKVLTDLLVEKGGEVLEFSTIAISEPDSLIKGQMIREMGILERDDWVVFTSANGIEVTAEQFTRANDKASLLALEGLRRCKIAVIGKKTKLCALSHGLNVDYISDVANSEAFAESFREYLNRVRYIDKADQSPIKVLLLRGKIASSHLPQGLTVPWITLVSLPVYDLRMPVHSSEEISGLGRFLQICEEKVVDFAQAKSHLHHHKIDMMIFTSSQAVKNFIRIIEEGDLCLKDNWKGLLSKIPVAVIGPETATTVEELGLCLEIVAEETSIEALVDTIVDYYGSSVA
ncbi:MAG: uroporphyrinogen-III synthase [Deltaproteobacteria bacterium]|nr:uroporphyrinogen-III synthase [Deltaproteobacteria bacterium]